MVKLYTALGEGGFAAEVVLTEAGTPHEIIYVDTEHDEHKSPRFLEMSPLGQLPVLELGPGRYITESAAIVIYLADRYAIGKLSPLFGSPMRPEFLRWMTFMSVNIVNAGRWTNYALQFSTDANHADGIKQAAVNDLDEYFRIVDTAIAGGPYFLGRNYSACDLYLIMLAHWHPDVPGLMKQAPHVASVCAKVKKRPAVREANLIHQLWN